MVCQPKILALRSSDVGNRLLSAVSNQLDQLREAYRSLNDITRNLASAQKCLKKEDLRLAEHHLRAAEWHLDQAKIVIAAVGQSGAKRR